MLARALKEEKREGGIDGCWLLRWVPVGGRCMIRGEPGVERALEL